MREMGAEPRRLVAVGGGAKNRLWLQIVSDACGLAQDIPERTIGASFGDAFLAGIATGLIADRSDLHRSWVSIATRLAPDADRHEAYGPYYDVYRSLYVNANNDLHELARLGQASRAD
jgi:xylulokinase